jgi:flagellar hook-associated protein FlgK
MNAFTIGISALTVGRRGLDLTGQNIANASTPGYSRQALSLSTSTVGIGAGNSAGVEVAWITRFEAPPLRTAILAGNGEQAAATLRLDTRRQIETALGQGENTIGGKLEQFFNQLERLTTRPSDTAVRRVVIASADELARQFNTISGDIDRLRSDLRHQITRTVDEVNSFTSRIADLNRRIYTVEVAGDQANELRDQRDQLVNQLSQKVDIRTVNMAYGVVNVIARDTTLVVGETATSLAVGANAQNLVVTAAGNTQPLRFTGGSLGGLLQEHNQDIPATRTRLDQLATEIARRTDHIQATGLGLMGPVTQLVGTRLVNDATQPLSTQGLPFPITNGTLTISVTNTSGPSRTASAIAIDPATMSLNDVAAAITAGTGGQVQATVDTPQNLLRLQAQPGFSFDFAGRPDSPPAGEFDPPTVSNPDTGGVLTGLGVNTLFQGGDANSLSVRPEFLTNPNLLAASQTGLSGDSSNLIRFSAIREQAAIGGRTLAQEYADIATEIGVQVRSLDDQQTAQAAILQNLAAQEQSVVGVSIDEEVVQLLEYQRMVEAASRFISVVNTALQSIIEITG